MADKEISGLTSAAALDGTELVHIVQSTNSRQSTTQDIADLKTSDVTSVFSRTGAVVAADGDYTLDQIATVDLTTTAPITDDVLTYDGTNWVPQAVAGGSGAIAQVVNTQTGTSSTTTTIIPFDNTIPQNTEGGEFMTLSITPTDALSTLIIEVHIMCQVSAAAWVTIALFQDTTANALAATGHHDGNGNQALVHKMTAGTTSATTFKVRAGMHTAGTLTFNGATSSGIYGGVCASSITITEVLP